MPPFEPPQVHVHGPLPVTADAVPALQSADAEGAAVSTALLAVPHTPFTGALTVIEVKVPCTPPIVSVVTTDPL